MDSLILRAALLLASPVSAVGRMHATDVMALCVAEARRASDLREEFERKAMYTAKLTHFAVCDPSELTRIEQSSTPTAPASVSASEAMFAAMPLQESAP